MARKVGEIFIDLVLGKNRFDRDLDAAAGAAKQAGDKIEGAANRGTRAYAALNTQVGALGQQLAGLSRVPGAGILAGAGAAGTAATAGLAAVAGSFFQRQQEVAFQNQQRGALADNAAAALGAIGAANRSALTPSQQREAEFRNLQAQFLRQNQQGLVDTFNQQSQGIGPLRQFAANAIRGLTSRTRYIDPTRLLPGSSSATSITNDIADFIGLDDNLSRELQGANDRSRAFGNESRRIVEAQERAAGITSNPAFGAASQLDNLQTMLQYQQETVELLKQIVNQGSAPQPGGATP
jgi:hypothetical protein